MSRTIAVLILLPLVACTSRSDDPSEPERAGAGRSTASSGDAGSEGNSGGEDNSGRGEGGAPDQSSLAVEEGKKDATSSGDVGGYPELSSAQIEGSSEGVTIDLRFARPVPQRTPPRVQMTLAFSIVDADGGRYLLNSLGGEEGWATTVVTSEGQKEFGGLFDISGNSVTFGIPWSDLGGPKPFNWIVSSAWTGDPKRGTSYAFDSIPNTGFAGFPATGNGKKSP